MSECIMLQSVYILWELDFYLFCNCLLQYQLMLCTSIHSISITTTRYVTWPLVIAINIFSFYCIWKLSVSHYKFAKFLYLDILSPCVLSRYSEKKYMFPESFSLQSVILSTVFQSLDFPPPYLDRHKFVIFVLFLSVSLSFN